MDIENTINEVASLLKQIDAVAGRFNGFRRVATWEPCCGEACGNARLRFAHPIC